jgi:hypothetical protein
MLLSFPILLMALYCGFEIFMFAPDPEEESLMLKNEGLLAQSTESGNISMRALWTISNYKVTGGAVWGEEEARKLLFKPLDIDATQITFDGKTCRNVIFQRGEVNAKEYLDNAYRTTPQALGIKEEAVEVVKTNCDLPGFAEYMRLKDRRLIIYLNGVFFHFKPAVNY